MKQEKLDAIKQLFLDLNIKDTTEKAQIFKLLYDNVDVIKKEVEKKINKSKFHIKDLGLKDGTKLRFVNLDPNNKEIIGIYSKANHSLKIGKKTFESLSKAALYAKNDLCGYDWKTISGPGVWYKGEKTLKEIFNEKKA